MEDRKYYVYFHYLVGSELPFYVGMGHGDRYKTKNRRNINWRDYIKEKDWFSSIVKSELTLHEALNLEKEHINHFGRKDNGTGILVNLNDGGSGNRGFIPSEDTLKKLSDSHKGQIAWNKGKTWSDETKKKIGLAGKGRKLSDETVQKMIKSRIGRKYSDETKNKIRNSLLGKKHTAERIEKNRLFRLGKPLPEETKTKMRLSQKIAWEKRRIEGKGCVSEETKRKISNTLKGNIPWNKGKKTINKGT